MDRPFDERTNEDNYNTWVLSLVLDEPCQHVFEVDRYPFDYAVKIIYIYHASHIGVVSTFNQGVTQ